MNRSIVWTVNNVNQLCRTIRLAGLSCALACVPGVLVAQNFVPGTGQRSTSVGDDFEDPKWAYDLRLPKSSFENDKQQRLPGGTSANGRWGEGVLRGQPDVIQRVATPEGGLAGSVGSLLLRSRETGVPGSPSYKNQQDDLIVNVSAKEGGSILVSRSPSVVVRVYLPPWDQWEPRTGVTFGFRGSCQAYKTTNSGRWGNTATKLETYWPGMFIEYNKAGGQAKQDSARLIVRAGPQGHDFMGPQITKPECWWTLGMSFSPDGQVHYYAHEGVDELAAKDHISSQYPYGFRCERLDTFFFDIVSGDNGSWSTAWVIDDPSLYYVRR